MWQGLDESDPYCVSMLQRVVAPALRDLEATVPDVTFAIDPRPMVGCGCVLLPPGMTYADVTIKGRTHPDFGDPFPTWDSVDLRDHWSHEQHVAYAASTLQSMAIAFIWHRTGVGGWPLCPVHRSHPLWPYPDRDLGIAVWECRGSGYRVPVGELSET